MASFGSLYNPDGDYPVKSARKDPFPTADETAPEPDSIANYQGGEVVYAERSAESGSVSYSSFSVALFPGVGPYAGSAVRLVGTDPNRARVVLVNSSDVPVYIGPLDQIAQGTGFILTPGATFDPQVQGAIFACLRAGAAPAEGSAEVGVWVEADS